MRFQFRMFSAITILSTVLAAPAYAGEDAVTFWNRTAVQTFLAAVPARPAPIPFLDVAMVQIAVYDAVEAIDGRFKPYHVVIPGASGSKEAATAKAAHDMLVHLFPAQSPSLDTIYQQYQADHFPANDPGVAVGAAAAAGIIALRANDGRFPPNPDPFNGGTDPGEWRPTPSFIGSPPAPPSFAPMAAPWLADVTPFALKSGDQFRPVGPPPLSSNRYTKAYNEAKSMGARFNSGRTPEQTDFALFWALNYASVWNRVFRDLAEANLPDIGDRARLFALTTLAMADAAITAWDSKVAFHFWRPITAIRLGDSDTNPDTVGDPDWQPMVNTPNYPDFTSGANNVTGAATRALALYFGTDDMDFTVRTTNTAAIQQTRDYSRFSDAAAEVVIARVYQGIHFDFADVEARKQGRHVADWVFGHFLRPVD